MLVTLLTDFGLVDGYVGAMKGRMLRIARGLELVDLTHEIPAGAIEVGAFVLRQAAPEYPAGAVHLAVVDPGVGSARRAVAVRIGAHRYVAPDNGLLTCVLDVARIGWLRVIGPRWLEAPGVSPVFHGRDVLGPVAAHLAAGGSPEDVGPEGDPASLARLRLPRPERLGSALRGEVIHVDRFGNLVTNLPLEPAAARARVELADGRALPLARAYSEVASGELCALRGSSGLLEIAQRDGSAAAALGAGRGLVILLRAF
jgi:hypothetical protein